MKTLLITGATGFIGRHLVEQAVNKGYKVIAAVRKTSVTGWLKDSNISSVVLDLSDTHKLVTDLNIAISTHGVIDVVIHNAGITQSLKIKDYYEANVNLTKNLIVALKESKGLTPKFIFTSSIAAIGPGKSDSFKPITENDNPHPVTHYGKSKLQAEEFIVNQKDLEWIVVRPTVVYGEHEKNFFNVIKTINNGMEFYAGSKKQMMSFIYVDDLADAFLSMVESDISNETFNISDGFDYQITEVNRIIKSVLNKRTKSIVMPIALLKFVAAVNELLSRITRKEPILNSDKVAEFKELNWLCDNSKLIEELGFTPKINFEEGITKTINWYKQNGWL